VRNRAEPATTIRRPHHFPLLPQTFLSPR
jgi:hypothetical protein